VQPDVVIIDTLVAVNAVPEDSNSMMRRVMAELRQICRRQNAAMILTHHDRKSGLDDGEDGDTNNARGAGDITNAVRFEFAVKKMTSAEAQRFGLNPKARTSYFRLGSLSSKVNYVAADEAEWFERVTHIVGEQAVAACIPWAPPDAFEKLTIAIINTILDDIDVGLPNGVRYSDANAARDRAAWKVVQKHCPEKAEAEAKRIINTWVRNNVLTSKKYMNNDRREEEMGLYVDPVKRPK
jgi:hypothetical protein